MLTIKHLTHDGVEIYTSETVKLVDKEYGKEELKAHISDLDLQCANAGIAEKDGTPITHSDMKAAIFFGGSSLYVYPNDQVYVTDEGGNTVYAIR